MIIHPLDVVKKRFQVAGLARSLRYGERVAAAEFSSFASAFGTILRKEGVRGFYKGLTPGLIKSAPASAITFAAYEAASRFVATARRRAEEGAAGVVGLETKSVHVDETWNERTCAVMRLRARQSRDSRDDAGARG